MRQRKRKHVNKDKKMIYIISGIFIAMFGLLIGYFIYFTIFKQKQMSIHPQNTRLNNLENEVVRGDIYDTNLVLLATTENDIRSYPRKSLYAHAVGYSQSGKTGVEALANTQLLYPNYSLVALFKNAFLNEKFEGRDVVLTLDDRYQTAIAEAMGDRKGGVVVLEPTTGKIRAMYSSTTFDPNDVVVNWSELTSDTEHTPLLNRASQGLYPPGSIFKIITALAYVQQQKGEALDFTYNCTGEVSGDNYTIQCFDHIAHGKVDLQSAFAKSCNSYFIKLSEQLSVKQMKAAAEALGFNQSLEFDMGASTSKFQLTESDTAFEKAATSIGQGKTLTSPLHMAIVAATIANDGVSWKPYLVDYTMNKSGKVKVKNMPKYDGAMIDEKSALILQDLMLEVVKSGTGSRLQYSGMSVGGKTGTAENETEADHSWFMGFAEDIKGEKTPIAFAVIVEGGGQGGKSLAVVQEILNVYDKVRP